MGPLRDRPARTGLPATDFPKGLTVARPDQKPGRRRAPEPKRRLDRRAAARRPDVGHGSVPPASSGTPASEPRAATPPGSAPSSAPASAGSAVDSADRPLELHPDVPLVPGPTTTSPEIPDHTQKRTRWRTISHGGLTLGWLVVTLAALAALLTGWVDVGVPSWLEPWLPLAGAVAVTTTYAFTLAIRTGGRPVLSLLLAGALSTGAVVSGIPVLLAAATVVTAAIGAVLGVLLTVPAARYVAVVRECLVATFVAAVAAFSANAYGANISVERSEYLALALALLATLALVYRLGAGFQGLGTRGAVVVAGGLGLLAVTLAYTEALARWGSPEMIESLETTWLGLRESFGAMPRPLEALLGFPALAWGISTRARRRQGWWPCAFGAAGLAGIATSLLDPRVTLLEAGMQLAYGLVIGLVLGYLVVRVDAFLSGTRGARARRAEEATAHRPEPRRTAPLL